MPADSAFPKERSPNMDSFEFNKIAGAVLSALLLMFGTPVLLDIFAGGYGKEAAKAAYELPEPDGAAATAGSAPAAKKGFDFSKVAALMAGASADAGKNGFKKCAACHTVNEGGKNRAGPNLYDVIGRKRASIDGFGYSKALVEKGGEWDYASLAEFLRKPKAWLKGTKMAFAGIRSDKDLASMLVYLQSLSANPKPLPKAE